MDVENIVRKQTDGTFIVELLSEDIRIKISETLENVVDKPFTIERIRWVDNFSFWEEQDGEKIEVKEEAFLIECEIETEFYSFDTPIVDGFHILLTVKELEERGWLPERKDDSYELLKSVLCYDMWHKYPVVWGELDRVFDKKRDYNENGKKQVKILEYAEKRGY